MFTLCNRSVHFGIVPVPNLCVELRGYDDDAVAVEEFSNSATDANGDAATPPTAGGHAWSDWGDTEPRFRQLQRTGKSDGSFVFVTPETGVTLVLAAYSNGGESSDVLRVFPDGPSSSGDKTIFTAAQEERAIARGEVASSAFGVESGRLLMHIDLAGGGGIHAPEVLWSAASRENDQSPCARTEAMSSSGRSGSGSSSSSATPLPTLDAPSRFAGDDGRSGTPHNGPAAATRGRDASPQQHAGRWSLFLEGFGQAYDTSGFGGSIDKATTALTALLQPLYDLNFFCHLGEGLCEAKRAVSNLLRSGLEAAGHRVHEGMLARSVWLSVMELPSLFERVSAVVFDWLQRRSREFSTWFLEASSPLFSWLEVHSPVNVRAWWVVWWAKVGVIAFIFGTLQQMFVLLRKACRRRRRAVEVKSDDQGATIDDDHRCSASPRQELASTSSMVGTFHDSDGRVSRIEIAKCCRPGEPTTAERRKGKGGYFRSKWGSNKPKQAADDGVNEDGKQEQGDEFSSMFRALDEPFCTVMNADDKKGSESGGWGASSVFVVTQQQSWS